ncbi:DUF481 domain-containing protein [Alteromonas sp. KUL49]|uniref:DUF481 domain-containing protein n=1 Tax=Alteromonas sp. KUL49 TaxID=2480798 RepID=UPI0010FFAB0A|nr:DUF481 domain-containing protein [Alteromonas sp. KUL49]GEA10652.1 hypothetical protein KUL49_10270 [Alteromonas sp. KUL49]
MTKHSVLSWSVLVCSTMAPALVYATPRDLIDDLYHADISSPNEELSSSLDGELGILLSSGNTSANSIKAGINAHHDTENWSNRYTAELLYKQSVVSEGNKQTTAHRFFGTGQFDYKLGRKDRRLFVYGDYENDRFNGYDHRASLAVGWSQRLWRDNMSAFRYSVGPGYSFVKPLESNNVNIGDSVIVRASAEYEYKWESGARLRQFLSTEAGEFNTKSRSETSVSANVFGEMAMKFSVVLNHDSDTPEDVASLNTETSVALVYQFF